MVKRVLAGVAAAGALLVAALAFPAAALAHVTVHSTDAVAGGYAVLTFRVPTESSTASTVKLSIQFPTEHPIASVLVQPHEGWTAHTVSAKLPRPVTTEDGDTLTEAVSQIVWSADSASTAIKPGEFDQFAVSAGPLPDVRTLTFSAIQYYSDGSVVRWNEVAAPGSSAVPDHPKPVLTLAASAAPSDSHAAAGSSDSDGSGGGSTALVIAIVALVLAAGALGLGVVDRARRTGH